MSTDKANSKKKRVKRILFSLFFLLFAFRTAHTIETPPRLIFSDAKLSFTIPTGWDFGASFPFGPLFTRKTLEGGDATIVCQISDPVDAARFSADAPIETLKTFAARDLSVRSAGSRVLAGSARTMAGLNAYEVTWLLETTQSAMQHQSIYFFMENRFYVLTLRAARDSFPWLVQDYQNWLNSVHLLTRQESGKLQAPSHGGVWVHQTAGARISIPEEWLIGVADDRQVGATVVRGKMHLVFSAVVDAMAPSSRIMSKNEKEEARQALKNKGRTIVLESEEPFHGLPAYQIVYEDTIDGRFVRGQDQWVWSPRARWLINVEGDSRLMRQMANQWQGILRNIHFYD